MNDLHESIDRSELEHEALIRRTHPVAYWHVMAARPDPGGDMGVRAVFGAVACAVPLVLGLFSDTLAAWLMIPVGLVLLAAALTRHWVAVVITAVTLIGLLLDSTGELPGRIRIALGFTLLAAAGAAMLPQRLTDRHRDRREAEARGALEEATGRPDLWDPSKIPHSQDQDWYRDPSRYE